MDTTFHAGEAALQERAAHARCWPKWVRVASQARWIAEADTCFIATRHPRTGEAAASASTFRTGAGRPLHFEVHEAITAQAALSLAAPY